MNLIGLKDIMKQGFHRFCDGTSMHGFTELFYAKTDFWKIVWIIIIGGALAVTTYQITGALEQYINQPSATLIQPALQQDLTYPPLKFCIAHWLHWIDYNKVNELNFSKEAFLFGMSYLTNIYSSELFNTTSAEESFTASMLQNNLSTVYSVYKALCKVDNIFPYDLDTNNEFAISDRNNTYFCFKAYGTDIFSYLQKHQEKRMESEKNSVELTVKSFPTTPLVNSQEYNSYMAEWIYKNTKQYFLNEGGTDGYLENYAQARNNYSKIHPPNILFIDGYSQNNIILVPEIDEYYITIKASAQRLKNKQSYKCKENTKSFASDTSCTSLCNLRADDHCSENPLKSFKDTIQLKSSTEPNKLEKNKIYFLNESTGTETTVKDNSTSFSKGTHTTYVTQYESSTVFPTVQSVKESNYSVCFTQTYNDCFESNCSVEGCEKWSYEVTVTTRSLFSSLSDVAYKTSTSVYVHYPQSGDVLLMTEMDSKTWEDFVGNVGGLLGIWTGASIISFVQIFYLFCLADMNCTLLNCWKRRVVHHDILLTEGHQIVRRKKVLNQVKTNELFK